MKRKLLLLSIVLMSIGSWAQTKNFIDQPYLETSAGVDTLVTPDRIYLQITLQESDTKGRISLEELEKRMGTRLKDLGVDLEEQLTVSDLSSNFGKYFLKKQDILKERSFQLLLYGPVTAGRVMFELEQVGISNVRLQKTEYSQMEDLKDILKARAVLRARRQGEIMTQALGQSLGRAIYISDNRFNIYNNMKGRNAEVMMAADVPQTAYVELPADFDKIRVEAGVQVRFMLE